MFASPLILGKHIVVSNSHLQESNVDGLHQKAGSSNVLEVHGSLRTARCPLCHREYAMAYLLSNEIPLCNVDGAVLKPDIVLYEGKVKYMEETIKRYATQNYF
ncbi:Sir2 family NAD-dependent protein deacetylase [Paenibacillus sp. TAB 01]|uniref:Sir2 family NAD-dependent protein deacetylase n=1 Tax=Paenibacillus sp. TAB 01 TaxID=3368988 RepID=UPI003752A812